MKILCGLFLVLTILFSGCSGDADTADVTTLSMGTFAAVSLPGMKKTEAERFSGEATRIMAELEAKLSVFREDSEISLLNRSAGGGFLMISGDTARVLELSLKYAELSGGCFDPTVGSLVRIWGFGGGTVPEKVPGSRTLRDALVSSGYRHLAVRSDRRGGYSAILKKKGMSVDLGGIAKGYAVDICFDKLLRMGASNFMVNAGGNIRCAGMADGVRFWKIGVRNPFRKDAILGTIVLSDGMAVATSGGYERFVDVEGKRFSHIIDPRTGCPAEGMAGVTVVGKTAVECDAMSTAFFVAGMNGAIKTIGKLDDCRILFVPDRQPVEIWITPNFAGCFEPDKSLAGRIFVIGEDGERRGL